MNGPQQFDYQQSPDLLGADVFQEKAEYAGFWLRFAAYIIDGILLYIVNSIFTAIIGLNATLLNDAGEFAFTAAYWSALGLSTVLNLAYFALMESSAWQATLGKKACSIKVTDLSGNRIGIGRAIGRYLGKIVSTFTLLIGFIMAGFTERKQALHDMMAGTLVVKS
ncbi:MAG: RDD family protein [Chitinophagaceae bacterium]|nr:RDD family protein [Chitinophagaceae bacterium]